MLYRSRYRLAIAGLSVAVLAIAGAIGASGIRADAILSAPALNAASSLASRETAAQEKLVPREQEGQVERRGRDTSRYAPTPRLAPPPASTDFQINSAAIPWNGSLPAKYSCDGESISPPISWKNAPAGTKSFALIMHHIPPGLEPPHVYWVVYGIPADIRQISENDATVGHRGINTVNRQAKYAPPCSKGPGKKWYTLTLYALSAEPTLDPASGVTRDRLLQSIKGFVIETAILNCNYERPREQQ